MECLMSPRPFSSFNASLGPIDYHSHKGFPSSSWWMESQATREQFQARAQVEAKRMCDSWGAKLVASTNYNEKLTAVFGSKSR